MAIVDLHLHTSASDGRLSPTELVHFVAHRGISIASITDHDSTEGLAEAFEAAAGFPHLTIIPGIELNTDIPGGEIHILGYFVPMEDQKFQRNLMDLRSSRVVRAKEMVEKLAQMGLDIEWDRVIELAGGGAVGRPHVAQAMVDKGHAMDVKEAFTRFIGRKGPAYVERKGLSPSDAIAMIRKAGGVPVLAHPHWVDNVEEYLPEFKKVGLEGIEVYYGNYSQETVQRFAQIAYRFDLIPCGGSDYHALGAVDEPLPGDLGPPKSVVEELHSRSAAKRMFEKNPFRSGVP